MQHAGCRNFHEVQYLVQCVYTQGTSGMQLALFDTHEHKIISLMPEDSITEA
jgi:hypothetical protein